MYRPTPMKINRVLAPRDCGRYYGKWAFCSAGMRQPTISATYRQPVLLRTPTGESHLSQANPQALCKASGRHYFTGTIEGTLQYRCCYNPTPKRARRAKRGNIYSATGHARPTIKRAMQEDCLVLVSGQQQARTLHCNPY